MKILMVCAEYAPYAKTGGLADAVTGLAEGLAARGHDVRVLLPRYAHVPAGDAPETIDGAKFRYVALEARTKTPRVYLLELPELASGGIYTGDDREAGRFLKLAEGAVLLPAAIDWQPDVVHCHDWHAALVPAFQAAHGMDTPVILTLHNIGYQGAFPSPCSRKTARRISSRSSRPTRSEAVSSISCARALPPRQRSRP